MAKKKPAKPYAEFPLFPHGNGQWAKKIKGRLHYFGAWDDPDAALAKYMEERNDLHAGRTPHRNGEVTVRDVLDQFLIAKRTLVDNSELSMRTWQGYFATAKTVRDCLGPNTPVRTLGPKDFDRLRVLLAGKLAAVALGNEIQRVRTIFKYAYDAYLVDVPVRFGPNFRKPAKRVVRREKHAKGKRMFSASELRELYYAAPVPLNAMILLAINCGYGQSDIANLPLNPIQDGWIDFPRPKTGVLRRCPLWPETAAAIASVQANRPQPEKSEFAELLFLTRFGRPWVRTNKTGTPDDVIGKRFALLRNEVGVKRDRVAFYAIRHTFETIGQEAKDPLAVQWIMGHAARDMGAHYREMVSDERLKAVTDTVYAWLFPRPTVG